ncbi:hypothetical protein [Paenibacillus alvei]|uniref:hypothetical protein n=1 Tax=Paenibacillus alvei TaxID=44250 RepID=UPI0013DCEB08|nr:hypothetical protein [Paenibacillus alvei]NEZ44388.1 hypothetical protein [Paenibacillus alvei]
MPDAFKAIIVIILLVICFVVFPAQRQADKAEDTAKSFAKAAIVNFVDDVRSKGYIDVRDYKVLLKSLDATNRVFDIQMEYYKKNIQPNYDNPNDINTFKEDFNVRYDGYFNSTILAKLFPDTLLEEDDPDRYFKMHEGDLFNVRIISKDKSLSDQIKSFIYRSPNVPIADQYGGMIRNEAP